MNTQISKLIKMIVVLFAKLNGISYTTSKPIEQSVTKLTKLIVSLFANLKGASFVGIKGYKSSTTGEVANHIVIANFSYGNAVEKDLKALDNATNEDVQAIANKSSFTVDLIKVAIAKLAESFRKNMNPETASAQSLAQQNAYINISPCIKLHIETGKLHIYALAHSKQVLVEGEYKIVNSRELTLCQNEVKRYFNFSTAKYRNFIVNPDQLSGVNINGEKIVLV